VNSFEILLRIKIDLEFRRTFTNGDAEKLVTRCLASRYQQAGAVFRTRIIVYVTYFFTVLRLLCLSYKSNGLLMSN